MIIIKKKEMQEKKKPSALWEFKRGIAMFNLILKVTKSYFDQKSY